MAGHSHWANIKHKKAANDAKKAKVITQCSRLIKGAIMHGGADLDTNPRLRLAVAKARSMNMTNDAIKRAIERFSGGNDDDKPMEELVYEGYAAEGVAVVVEALTDNRNRTAPEIRKLFERGGGSMGAPGCVAWQFHQKATFLTRGADEDRIMEILLEADADAEDIAAEDDEQVSITAAPEYYDQIANALDQAGVEIVASDVAKMPENTVAIDDVDTGQKIQRLLDALDDHDDVTSVSTNFAPSPAVAETLD